MTSVLPPSSNNEYKNIQSLDLRADSVYFVIVVVVVVKWSVTNYLMN